MEGRFPRGTRLVDRSAAAFLVAMAAVEATYPHNAKQPGSDWLRGVRDAARWLRDRPAREETTAPWNRDVNGRPHLACCDYGRGFAYLDEDETWSADEFVNQIKFCPWCGLRLPTKQDLSSSPAKVAA